MSVQKKKKVNCHIFQMCNPGEIGTLSAAGGNVNGAATTENSVGARQKKKKETINYDSEIPLLGIYLALKAGT